MKAEGVAIVGASGYAARELIQILLKHPGAKVTVATSRQDEAPRLDALHPSLYGRIDLACEPFHADKVAERASVAFLGLPHTASLEVVPALRERGVRVIDLSADYRLKDARVYADWYGHEHTDPAGLRAAVYGLPELYREAIPSADLIANPGCYTSTSILALAPLIADDLIERQGIVIDAKSGVSGAGRAPKLGTHFPECNESFSAYNVGKHRHTPEIDQVLSDVGRKSGAGTGAPVEVIFTPHLVPMDRGIFATIYAVPKKPVTEHDLMERYRAFYARSPFVRVVPHLPTTKDSAYTNFFDVTLRLVRGKVVILACLDNLLKGAAGVAVQNFNLMFGHPERTALI
jgi:N-acetyl-gamma-glutamyl-phosphate reductase